MRSTTLAYWLASPYLFAANLWFILHLTMPEAQVEHFVSIAGFVYTVLVGVGLVMYETRHWLTHR